MKCEYLSTVQAVYRLRDFPISLLYKYITICYKIFDKSQYQTQINVFRQLSELLTGKTFTGLCNILISWK